MKGGDHRVRKWEARRGPLRRSGATEGEGILISGEKAGAWKWFSSQFSRSLFLRILLKDVYGGQRAYWPLGIIES